MEGRHGRNRQSDSSALECGHLELWVIELLADVIFSCGYSLVVDREKVSALRLRHPTACSVFQAKWSLVNYDTVSNGGGALLIFIHLRRRPRLRAVTPACLWRFIEALRRASTSLPVGLHGLRVANPSCQITLQIAQSIIIFKFKY